MKPLEKLMQEYGECEEIVNQDLSGHPAKTLPGMTMRQNECRERMLKIRSEYRGILLNQSFSIFLQGDPEKQKRWVEIADEEAKLLMIDVQALYRRLAEPLEDSLGARRTFGVSQLAALVYEMIKVGKPLDARDLGTPQIQDMHLCPTFEDLINYIRDIVRSTSGDRLNRLWIESELLKMATETRYTQSITPVLLYGATPEEAKALGAELFDGRTFIVDVTDENLDRGKVIEALTNIRKQLKAAVQK